MLNGFLQSQGFPKNTQFDVKKPSETISNLINYAVKKNLMVEIDSMPYVKPTIGYVKDVLKLGKSREYLEKMNKTELSNKLTDTLNLEVSWRSFFVEFEAENLFIFFRSSNRFSRSIELTDMRSPSLSAINTFSVKSIHTNVTKSSAWVVSNPAFSSSEVTPLHGSLAKRHTRHFGLCLEPSTILMSANKSSRLTVDDSMISRTKSRQNMHTRSCRVDLWGIFISGEVSSGNKLKENLKKEKIHVNFFPFSLVSIIKKTCF